MEGTPQDRDEGGRAEPREIAGAEPPLPVEVSRRMLAADPTGGARRANFLWKGTQGALWYERRSPKVLFVAFDNLATLDHAWPRLPWMHARIAGLGYSLLGVQSFRKDWYRNQTSPAQLAALVDFGFFRGFETVIFSGASMGGFAALNFAPMVPGARVLAFSPQSTMNAEICPFEKRFGYAVARGDWSRQPYLDAAAAAPYQSNAWILYDPFTPEDRAHAARLAGRHVHFLPLGHSGHQAIRTVVKSDALPQMIREFAETGRIGVEFWRNMRGRRGLRSWRRELIGNLARRNHPKLLLRACAHMEAEGNYLFCRTARRAVLEAHPELADWALHLGEPERPRRRSRR